MIPALITALSPVVSTLVDRLIPDAHERERARVEIEAKLIDAANAANLAQLEVNKTEASHRSIWVAGWRPGIGWTCAAGFAWAYVGHPVASWVLVLTGNTMELPAIQTDNLLELLLAMLGMAGLRTFDKLRGLTK
jgi:hypothetical protein